MSAGLIPIPTDRSLVEVEPTAAAWIDSQEDREELTRARSLLAAWRIHYQRGSDEAAAARRLDLRAERRIGMLLPEAQPGPRVAESDTLSLSKANAEVKAESRARALASVPAEVFEEEIAKPKPSRDAIVAAAVVGYEPDPSIEETQRLLRVVKGPRSDSWPHLFDIEHLNGNAISTVKETINTWERWSASWQEALKDQRKLREIR